VGDAAERQRPPVWATLVSDPVMYRRYLESWRRWTGIDMEAARKYAANTPLSIRPTSDQFLAEPERWTTLDDRTIDSPNVAAKIEWPVSQPGTARQPDCVYRRVFLPFAEPLTLACGDTLRPAWRRTRADPE
jgi:hypothetical protein